MKSAQWHSDTFCNHILISVESVGVMLLGSVCKSVARILLVSGQEAAWPGLGRRECCTVLYLCTIPGTAPLRLKRGLEEKLLQWFSYLTLEDDDFDEWNSSEKDNSRNCRRSNDKNQCAHEFCICRLCLRWRGKGSLSPRMCWCFAFAPVFCILLYLCTSMRFLSLPNFRFVPFERDWIPFGCMSKFKPLRPCCL